MDYSFHKGTSVLVKSKLLKTLFSNSEWDNRKHHSTSGSNE